MPRYIDADSLMRQLNRKKAGTANKRYTEGFNDALMRFRSMVSTAPTVSPDEVRGAGEWIGDGDGYADGLMVYDMWSCSCCGEYFDEWDDRPTWKFCPSCGARMKGVDEDA